MKTVDLCSSCVLHDLVGALDRLELAPEVRARIVRRSLEHLARAFDYSHPPSFHITAVHRILKEETGLALPFAALRERCNEVGMAVAARVAAEAGWDYLAEVETCLAPLSQWTARTLDDGPYSLHLAGRAFDAASEREVLPVGPHCQRLGLSFDLGGGNIIRLAVKADQARGMMLSLKYYQREKLA